MSQNVVFGEIVFKDDILRFLVSNSGNLVKNSFEDLDLWESDFFYFMNFELFYDLLVLFLDFVDDDFLDFKEKILNFFVNIMKIMMKRKKEKEEDDEK
jgi:hypothetical protein